MSSAAAKQEFGFQVSSFRRARSAMMLATIWSFSIIAIIPLLLVFYYVTSKGISGLSWEFFTSLPVGPTDSGGGLVNAIAGSLMIVGMASLVGVPIGVLTGVFLSEFGEGKLAATIRFTVDLMTSVPSIIIGLFVYTIVVVPMNGFSAYAGAVALAVIMFPIVAKTTEEVLKLIPDHIREAGLALGIPRWKVIIMIVLKGSIGPVATGVILAVARVMGETAPLLFTAFGNQFWPDSPGEPTSTLPVAIYQYAISPYKTWHEQAWAGALVLVMIVFFANLITRIIMRGSGMQQSR